MPLASPDQPVFRGALALAAAAWLCAQAGCAGAMMSSAERSELMDVKEQLATQASQLQQQQQRLEQLEARVAGVQARDGAVHGTEAAVQGRPAQGPSTAQAPAKAQAPGQAPVASPKPVADQHEPKNLRTFKLEAPQPVPVISGTGTITPERPEAKPQAQPGGRHARPLRVNPVERAPRLPSEVELKEPDERTLSALEEPAPPKYDRRVVSELNADASFQEAVQTLNAGEHLTAQARFLAFAAQHPKHAAADNALYYAGLSRGALDDCAGALPLLTRVLTEYPAGDAVAPASLEKARCLLKLGREREGRALLTSVVDDFAGTAEASVAKALLAQNPGLK